METVEIDFELVKVAHVALEYERMNDLAGKLLPFTNANLAKGKVCASFDLRTVYVPPSLLQEASQALATKGYREWAGSLARAAQL